MHKPAGHRSCGDSVYSSLKHQLLQSVTQLFWHCGNTVSQSLMSKGRIEGSQPLSLSDMDLH